MSALGGECNNNCGANLRLRWPVIVLFDVVWRGLKRRRPAKLPLFRVHVREICFS